MASKSMFTKYSDGNVVVLSALRSELEDNEIYDKVENKIKKSLNIKRIEIIAN